MKNNNNLLGPVLIFISAMLFALGGVCITFIPWQSLSINGARSLISISLIGIYMLITKHKIVWNKSVLLGAFFMCSMMKTYVISNKLTSAANAIVLLYTAPILIIIFMAIFFHKMPVCL